MEEDPFAVIEAMTIAAFATGCEQGYIYIRGEYPLATERLLGALAQARARRPARRARDGRRRSASTSNCAAAPAPTSAARRRRCSIRSKGFRGEPRNKPPFPVQSGLFGKPTVVNNVETLVNVLDIVRDGGAAFAATGTEQSTGTKLFCVSGCAVRPGVYEVPFGITLEGAHRSRGRRPRRPAAAGRAAWRRRGRVRHAGRNRFAADGRGRARRRRHARLGRRHALRRSRRTCATSRCGSPSSSVTSRAVSACRAASARSGRRKRSIVSSRAKRAARSEAEFALIDDLAQAMRDASICGLGHTASPAVQSAIRKLRVFG